MTSTGFEARATAFSTVTDALRLRREKQPDEAAYIFLRDGEEPGDTLTYRELDDDARSRAAALAGAGLAGGRAVLLYPSGLEFIRTLLGCLHARIAAAPVQVPNRRSSLRRLRRIADDAGTTTVLTTGAIKQRLEADFADAPELHGLVLIDTESLVPPADGWSGAAPEPGDIALLQYTSGSTGDPKGVMVTHANFVANVAETEESWPLRTDDVVVSWLPLFHDMGMLFGIMLPLCAGIPAYLMAPEAFIRRPQRWLRAISRFRGTHAAAPSFAYDLCVRAAETAPGDALDLSCWRVAANGAEPVRWHTIEAFTERFAAAGFAAEAMCAGYGLAENTLKATASVESELPSVRWVSSRALREGRAEPAVAGAADVQPLVGSGRAAGRTRVRVVDPQTRALCPPGVVGEVWIHGPCVALGYLDRAGETAETFAARIAGDPTDAAYLRTGDLGFLVDDELYVTGRLKDVIIRSGRNYYPQDIELLAESAAEGLRTNCAAAFSVDDGRTEQLIVVVEADGRVLRATGPAQLRDRIHAAIRDGVRLDADQILLVQRGTVPRTSSGKVQRRACRSLYLDGQLTAAEPVQPVRAGAADVR
ncbi:acyl-CoA synthetase (AMP-forming)/AMP-acid ligase II [Actinoplanes octamycinicus]|uniref:Acyl-CoA synthetase (AMP-forming)/AMP-acid ligase II n=1 Tax=Actinoplanes octamycinicus TaxID=135948 RepID=A0A7W7M806_9ACTN|nr:fatty acyl-AMP ligase [Actinoplanes octamycinicus]MBB4740370.1 acyl-CoA synthetase (AMP-forming)/AMP-acid ligase II [Actinoplanes octamycinicus]GIE62556.1 acyl-CoA synthetase [Actinoplanes octamycinicus]